MEHLEDISDDNYSEKCSVIIEGIKTGEFTILKAIEQLGFLLTDETASKRVLGVTVLSEVLSKLPSKSSLNGQELSVIASFYADKLKDYHQVVPPSLKGILTIIEFEKFPGESVKVLLNSLFHNVSCQQQQQCDRNTIYRIFDILVRKFNAELLSMKLDFVYGVLQSIDGERDPRNLLFLFKWLQTFLKTFSLGHLAEDFFEVLACYFPVDFRAPPSEKSITRDALADALLPCLTAVPEFGEFCISLALEKLDSSLTIAKLDSLKLLKVGCVTFDASAYLDKAPEITSQLQKEIFANPTSEIKPTCLETMTAVIKKISPNLETSEHVTRNIVDTLKGNLIPDSKFYRQSEDVLSHVALGSEPASSCVSKELVPILANMYAMDKKLATLNTLVRITQIHLKHHPSLISETVPDLPKVPLLCLEALSCEAAARQISCDSFAAMAPHLPEEIRLKLYQYLSASFESEAGETQLRVSELRCLRSLASNYPSEVQLRVFEAGEAPGSSVLKALASVADLEGFGDYAVDTLLRSLRIKRTVAAALAALKLLLQKEGGSLAPAFLNKDLLHLLIASASSDDSHINLGSISKILKLLISPLDGARQSEVLRQHLGEVYARTVSCHGFLVVLDGLLAGLQKGVEVGLEIMEVSLEIALRGEDEGIREVAVQLLANLINKRGDGEELHEYLAKIQAECTRTPDTSAGWVIFWVTKALIMKNSAQSTPWLEFALKFLDEHNEAVKGLEILMNDSYESLNVSCHCNKLPIYRQKVFVYITNRISENYNSNKLFYSKATACLLKYTPLQVMILQFKKISKLILLCMETEEEPENLNVLLKILKDILISDSSLIEDQLEDYLTRILRLTTFPNSMEVRIQALQCVVLFTSLFPLFKLLPFKNTVLHNLSECIDDKKRLVRRQAVEARSLWFLLDAPI